MSLAVNDVRMDGRMNARKKASIYNAPSAADGRTGERVACLVSSGLERGGGQQLPRPAVGRSTTVVGDVRRGGY